MISTEPLYNPQTHRYKGVYPSPGKRWDAIVQTPDGKLKRLGRFLSQDQAAVEVASYYEGVYGKDWPQALRDRLRRVWRIRRFKRYPERADLHRGAGITVYGADVRMPDRSWHRITPDDFIGGEDPHIENETIKGYISNDLWNKVGDGWRTTAAALVVIRMYRHMIADRTGKPVSS